MRRREVLQILATGTALQLAPSKLLMFLREARALIDTSSLRTLNAHQDATVKALAEMIIPRTDTPGATDVGASAFIDLMLTEWYDDEDRNRFLKGLADVDSQARALIGKDFVDCAAAQQADMLRVLGEKMIEEAGEQARVEHEFPSDASFYPMLRRLTLTAYYTSEAGATDELHFEMIPGRFIGCQSASPIKEAPQQK
ncbi:MAG TPA: gluconate 2-dehydrogenase subunit 3 family protein [Candidatus Sulfotelmatobacter sp.]|nr:gluconate 2-dehydrogenase subunit 3 family protein [Candidatus Sulfotelmatobacter sp.]